MAMIIAVRSSVTAGIISGIRRGGPFDNATLVITLILIALPIVVWRRWPSCSSESSWARSRPPPEPIPGSSELILPGGGARPAW